VAPTFLSSGDACYNAALNILSAEKPVFLSRIGGSDTNALISYLLEKDWPEERRLPNLHKHMDMVSRFNGYYDKSGSRQLYFDYCETLYDCYKQSPHLVLCNYQLLSLYFQNFLHPSFYKEDFEDKQGFRSLVDSIIKAQPEIVFYPYSFIERLIFDDWTFFRVLSKILEGMKVLVISPFGESIKLNFPMRHSFFKRGYKYPEFSLKVYNTPITYAGLPNEFYPDENWFQTLDRIKEGVSKIDFDMAFLSCGSYALPVGNFIAQKLQRKAVYVGGILQIFFGIMGRRWENSFSEEINREAFIYPVEREKYLRHFAITDQTAREAFGAYF